MRYVTYAVGDACAVGDPCAVCDARPACVRALIAGGGAPEMEMSLRLSEYAATLAGVEQYCLRAFADALDVTPFTLAENAGLNPIATVTELRNRHAAGERTAGINVRKVGGERGSTMRRGV